MKYRRLPQFDADYARLFQEEREKFRLALRVFISACSAYEQSPANFTWPSSLRFEKLPATKKVLAITWSFAGPGDRATFHFETVAGEMYVVWRRVGRHDIYQNP